MPAGPRGSAVMAATMNMTQGVNGIGGALTVTFAVSSGAGVIVSESIPAPSTDLAVGYTLTISKCASLFMYCREADMTVETNSGTSPGATVTLKAGKPIMWYAESGLPHPFGATNVTGLFVTLAGTAAAVLELQDVRDPT